MTADIFVGFRYEYNIRFFRSKEEARLRPCLGFSVNPYYSYLRYSPMVSSSFPAKGHMVGANLFLIPRVQYIINKKWFIDLNIPLHLAGIEANIKRIENPTMPDHERGTSTIEFSEFPAIFQFRIGLGLNL